jgi:IS6 family transposase
VGARPPGETVALGSEGSAGAAPLAVDASRHAHQALSQATASPMRSSHSSRQMVRALPAQLRRRRGVARRTGRHGQPKHRLPLGTTVLAALRRGCPCLLSASRWEVARRRDVLPPRWPMGVLLSGDRRGWAGSGGILYSKRRNASAAQAFFERAIAKVALTPKRVVTDRARCYPPALRAVLPSVEHRCSRYLNNALERDHGHLKQRLRPMRGFKRLASADTFSRGHALIQNLRNGFSTLTTTVVPRRLRLLEAWPQLAQVI